MSIVISAYSKGAYKEYFMPNINNADHEIVLDKDHFGLTNSLTIKLEVIDNKWKLFSSLDYRLFVNKTRVEGVILKNGQFIDLWAKTGETISFIIQEIESTFRPYSKYDIFGEKSITIGKEESNDIVYNSFGMVSRRHAEIKFVNRKAIITNKSQNGIYVNSKRVDGSVELSFGDLINIIGLRLVFLGDSIAIDSSNPNVFIKSRFHEISQSADETAYLSQSTRYSNGKLIYHRAPRRFETPENKEIEIEAPPQEHKEKEQSMAMLIGPSITMAFPMLLGCILMIYAYSGSGNMMQGRSSLFMYSGLVMAISSALVGVMWTLINTRNRRKEFKKEHDYRLEKYSEYLIEKAEEVKEAYSLEMQSRIDNYPDADSCLGFIGSDGKLWNHNIKHPSFLEHRVGTGNIPFSTEIKIPPKRFVLYPDSLDEKPRQIKEEYKTLFNVPITVDLSKKNLIGIIGGENKKGAVQVAQALCAQIAANNSYSDVKMAFILNDKEEYDADSWSFTKWLPHVWDENHTCRFVATTPNEKSDVLFELTNVLRAREENEGHKKAEVPKPYFVMFVSNQNDLENELIAKYVYDKKTSLGLTTIFLVERYEDLPNDCDFIIENTDDYKGIYSSTDIIDQDEQITFDSVDPVKLESFARTISGYQIVEASEGGDLPSSLTFFEMLGIRRPEDLPVAELWAKNRTYENIRGMLGQKAGGAPCFLDVHEKYHGPHGLVAGTTGSGKSETLQTYMLSLAINYSPNDIGFFVIDYKGGGMANLFNGLPHMMGQISNLSGNQVKRAMISIKSENKRRQKIFNENGVNNINNYTKLVKSGEATMPIPHLFIVIDEFAELKREEPDFMQELISVAQVGRSLGVHLILATQKPSGTVDDNIWSNSKFKLCLRVQDRQDSNDMLHKPDAAYITQAGRCYLQVGNDEVYELFQSGYSGAVYDESFDDNLTEIAKMIDLTGKVELTGNSAKQSRKQKSEIKWINTLITAVERAKKECDSTEDNDLQVQIYNELWSGGIDYPMNKFNSARLSDLVAIYDEIKKKYGHVNAEWILKTASVNNVKLPQSKEKTQLDAVKSYLGTVASNNGYNFKHLLWLPILKEELFLEDLYLDNRPRFTENGDWFKGDKHSLKVLVGQMDDPENQNQMPFELDILEDFNLAVCGSVVSGKSTLMQTLCYSLIDNYSPSDINIYAIDFSSKMMEAFEDAPHFGGIMYENDLEKISKFFNMIEEILEDRKKLLKGGSFKQYLAMGKGSIPAIVIMIDNYAALKEKTDGQYEDIIFRLSKEGNSNGIYIVLSGTGFGMNDISNRIAENIKTVLTLSLQDKFAYADLLHTMAIDVLPESGIKGRGLALYGDRVLEYQTALAVEAGNDYERMELIKQKCSEMKAAWKGKSARHIPDIPKKPIWSDLYEHDDFEKYTEDYKLPVGYNSTNAKLYGLNLRDIYCYGIYGSKRTGKTNFLKTCIYSAIEMDSTICIIDNGESSMAEFSNGDHYYCSNEKELFNFFKDYLLPEFKTRNVMKQGYLKEGYSDEELDAKMKECTKPIFIMISDLSNFIDMIYDSEYDMKGFLDNIISRGEFHNIYFFGTLSMEKRSDVSGYPVFESFKSYSKGIHFGGKVADNSFLSFDGMSYADQLKTEKTGIGIVPSDSSEGTVTKVVVPLAKKR